MKRNFKLIMLFSISVVLASSCVTGEYDLAFSDSNASSNENSKTCIDPRDIYFNKIGLGCSEPETVNRYIGTWEATIQGSDPAEKYLIEITNNPEDYRINIKTNFAFYKNGNRGKSEIDLMSPIDIDLNVINHRAESINYPDNVVKHGDINIFGIIFFTSEREIPKIIINATIVDKYVGFTDNVIKLK